MDAHQMCLAALFVLGLLFSGLSIYSLQQKVALLTHKVEILQATLVGERQTFKQHLFKDERGGRSGEAVKTVLLHERTKRRADREIWESKKNFSFIDAIQYSGDVKPHSRGRIDHRHYHSDGLVSHINSHFVDWTSDEWAKQFGMDHLFDHYNGTVTVRNPGIYFIYAQIYYIDQRDRNGFLIMKNNNKLLLQCVRATHSASKMLKADTCFTAGLAAFESGDRIFIRDLGERASLLQPGKSFFGMMRLSGSADV